MIINNLKNGMVESIRTQDKIIDIENIEENIEDFFLLNKTKTENNQKYTINEAEKLLDSFGVSFSVFSRKRLVNN